MPEGAIVVRYPRVTRAGLLTNLGLGLVAVAFSVPLLWLIFASVDSNASWQLRLPNLTTANYSAVLHSATLRPIWNSFYLAGVSTAITVVLSVFAGYALSKKSVPLRRTILIAILFTTGIPITMMVVPIYELFSAFSLLDSLLWTSIFLAASSLPFAIWLMKNFIDAVPDELEEAAVMDGAGSLRVIVRVIVPLVMPGIFVTAIVTFINSWGQFLIPLVLISNPNSTPGAIAVYQFLSQFTTPRFGQLAAYSLIFSLPVIVLYLGMARRLSGAFTLGGSLKG
jgi:multiple sugar transport system permease protein